MATDGPTATAAQTPLDAANDVWFEWSGREGRGSAEFTIEVVSAVQRAMGERLTDSTPATAAACDTQGCGEVGDDQHLRDVAGAANPELPVGASPASPPFATAADHPIGVRHAGRSRADVPLDSQTTWCLNVKHDTDHQDSAHP